MLRSTIGLTDKLMTNEITLDELTPTELTWVMRYAYAQYFYQQSDNRLAAAMYYDLSHNAALALIAMIEAVPS